MTANPAHQPQTRIPLWAGCIAFFLAQTLVAASMVMRGDPSLETALRAKTVAVVSGITLGAAVSAWILSGLAGREAVARPALAVAGGLAASLLRLTVPLMALAWLQFEDAVSKLPLPQREFMAETIVVSYLVLLFVDILLNTLNRRPQHNRKN